MRLDWKGSWPDECASSPLLPAAWENKGIQGNFVLSLIHIVICPSQANLEEGNKLDNVTLVFNL